MGLVVLLLLVIAAAAGAASRPGTAADESVARARDTAGCASGDGAWDAGNIISDAVFYNAAAMTVTEIQEFLDRVGGLLRRR